MQVGIQMLLENGVDLEKNINVNPHIIKGLNMGVLLILNELLDIPANLRG